MRYFAYGSNLSRARIEARLGPVVDLGRARLPGRIHRFSKRGRDGTGKGNIEAVAGAPAAADLAASVEPLVWGVVYELSSIQLDRLSEFEFGYRMVEVGLAEGAALSYEALAPGPERTPTREYLEHYVTGIREHGIPEAYLHGILGDFRALLG